MRRLNSSRWDLLAASVDVTTTAGRTGFFQWLLNDGKTLHCLRNEEIWWFLLQSFEDPVAELVHEYSISPAWQNAFPEAMTDLGWPRFYRWAQPLYFAGADPLQVPAFRSPLTPFEQLRLAYDHRPRWRAEFPDAFHDPAILASLVAWLGDEKNWRLGEFDSAWIERIATALAHGERPALGINIIGHFSYPSGLQASVKSVVKSLTLMNVPMTCHDVPVVCDAESAADRSSDLHEIHDVSLIHVQPEPLFDAAYRLANLRREPNRYRIGMWYWEFAEVPAQWKKIARKLNELWAPTRFIADALKESIDLPVVPMLPGVELGRIAPVQRRRFGIPDDKVFFLFMYDMNSAQERKNPLGVIRAFREAFRADDRVHLAIKVSRGRNNRLEYAKLAAAAKDAGVQVINTHLPRDEAYGLMQCCDCYVSLHRSEGLGLTMAEAMLMGKPVIATAYSGNIDFMTANDSLLVNYRLVPMEQDCPPYEKGWLWAEPSVEEAANSMRWVLEHRDDGLALGTARKRRPRTSFP